MTDIPLTGHPGPLIRRMRHDRGWSLRDFEAVSGYDFSVIARVESGRHKPTYPVFRDLFEALGYELVLRRRDG